MVSTANGLQLTHVHGSHFDIGFASETIARYVYSPDAPERDAPKPYVEPVRTLAGDLVSIFRPHDHPWHKGIQFALPHVGDHNLWGGPTFVRESGYVHLDNNGSMRHEGFDCLTLGSASVDVVERLGWFTAAGQRIADERRELSFDSRGAADGAWALRFATSIRNCGQEPLLFSSPTVHGRPLAGYGGLAWRGPRCFTGGQIIAPGGRSGPDLMGQTGSWLGFVGRHDGNDRSATVVFVDQEGSLQQPVTWFVRTEPYAMICAAPFFDQEVSVPAGEDLRLANAVIVANGAWDEAAIEGFIKSRHLDQPLSLAVTEPVGAS
jgi:hypothetical protein